MKIGKVLNERWELKGKIADRQDFEEYDPFAFGNGTNKNKYRGGYIRCDFYVVTHCFLVYDVIYKLFTLKNSVSRCSNITRERRADGRTRPLKT